MQLPEASSAIDLRPETPAAAAVQVSREALRLRVRWMQELLGRAAYEIGVRLVERGELQAPGDVAALRFDDVAAVVAWQTTVNADVLPGNRTGTAAAVEPEPLPARFQLSDTGMAIALFDPDESGGGTGAGGGVSRGPVTHDAEHPPEGSVLVVGALTPQLGPLLPGLAGIVAETGSVLSHLAILARESGVATVVGHPGARQELEDGALVTVDGNTGRVTVEEAT
jgi:phosphohistidine swiveling domain-containing protein